jgi:hypothetical protein
VTPPEPYQPPQPKFGESAGQPTYGQSTPPVYEQPAAPPVYGQPGGYPPPVYGPPGGYPPPVYGAPGGYPFAPGYGAPTSTDGLSIAALVFGIIGGFLLAIPFGIAGLVRTKSGRRRGRGLAIAGLALSGVWVIVLAAIVAYGVGRSPDRSADGTVTHQGAISPVDLRVGDCLHVPGIDVGDSKTIRELTVVPCSQPHNGQMIGLVQSSDTVYPGQSQLTQEGLSDCTAPAREYLGKATTRLNLVAFVPNQILWDGGERAERCVLVDRIQDITGDIRDYA